MKQLLPFKVGYETYALELVEVQEVVENQNIYPFPGTPDVISGAIAFHGRIVPVIDLALLLDFPTGKIGQRLIVLVNRRGPVTLGVDQVRTVINLEINHDNRMQNYTERNYIKDVINYHGKMISLFDLDQFQIKLESLCTQGGD
jgi:purine-binding chemotaxis protein CheW